MKTVTKYFGMLHRQSSEAAREVARVVRSWGFKVLCNHENAALEIEADAQGAELLRATGVFEFLTSNAIKKDHVKSLEGTRFAVVGVWNSRFRPSFRKSKREGRELRELSWAAEGRREPVPHSAIDHIRLGEELAKHADRLKIHRPKKRAKAWYRKIKAEEYKAMSKRLRERLKDDTLTYHLARALVKLPPWAYEVVQSIDNKDLKAAADEPPRRTDAGKCTEISPSASSSSTPTGTRIFVSRQASATTSSAKSSTD